MSFVQCFRADGSPFIDITHGMLADWFLCLHPTGSPAPVIGVWADVPDQALPEGIARSSFNAYGYIEWRDHVDSEGEDNDEIADPIREPPVDTRPLVSPLMRDENPEEHRRLWDLNPTVGPCDVMPRGP